jgi:hypothetical protein
MPFLVQAKSERPGDRPIRAEKATRKDAVMTAVGLIGQGMVGVTITDEAGRVFDPPQFPQFFKNGVE